MGSVGDPCGRGPGGGAAQRPQQAHGAPARCRRDAGRGTPAASGSRQLGEGGHGPPAPCRLTFRTRIPPGRRDAAASGGSGGSSGPAGPGSTSPMGGQGSRDARPALQRASLGGARELREASPLRLGPAPNPYTPPLAAPPRPRWTCVAAGLEKLEQKCSCLAPLRGDPPPRSTLGLVDLGTGRRSQRKKQVRPTPVKIAKMPPSTDDGAEILYPRRFLLLNVPVTSHALAAKELLHILSSLRG